MIPRATISRIEQGLPAPSFDPYTWITDFSGLLDVDGDLQNFAYGTGRNDDDLIRESEDQYRGDREFVLAVLKMQAVIYLLDKEAIKSGLMRVPWFDEHGNVAWKSRLNPLFCDLEELTGAPEQQPISLVEITECDGSLVPVGLELE